VNTAGEILAFYFKGLLFLSFPDSGGCARTQAVYHPWRGTSRVIGMWEPLFSMWAISQLIVPMQHA